jgi:cold-inducible RNA-binding protein
MNLFIGNLSYQTTETELAATFGEFGQVERASVARDRDSGQSRGFGFVEMSSAADANRAMNALNGEALNGRALNVNEARPREVNGGARRENRW